MQSSARPTTRPSTLTTKVIDAGRRAIEGDRVWGRIDISPSGGTFCTRYRLTVYAPGTNAAERRALTFHRNWPVVGAVIALLVLSCLGGEWPVWLVTALSVSVYLSGFWMGSRLTAGLRGRSRRLEAAFIAINGTVESYGFPEQLFATVRALDDLDEDRSKGAVSPTEYEARWASIYRSMPSAQ